MLEQLTTLLSCPPVPLVTRYYFGVTTGNLNKAMKRNVVRFPENFCFQLSFTECSKFQIGILNAGRGEKMFLCGTSRETDEQERHPALPLGNLT